MVTAGAAVYPEPPAVTAIAVIDTVEVAEAPAPGPVLSAIETAGADIYPEPGFVIVKPMIAPVPSRIASADAPVPPPPLNETTGVT
jgi:hypothetical protein